MKRGFEGESRIVGELRVNQSGANRSLGRTLKETAPVSSRLKPWQPSVYLGRPPDSKKKKNTA